MSIVAISLRAVLLRKRVLGVAVLPMLVAAVAITLRFLVEPGERTTAYAALTGDLLLPLVIAIAALMLGVNAFDDERDDGTFPLLMATNLPRWQIVVAKLAAAWLGTWLVCLPAVLACIALGLSTDLPAGSVVWSALVASVLAAGGYVALFVLLSLLVRRAVLVGLAYVVLWEGLLAPNATAFRNLSVGAYGRRLAAAPWDLRDVPFSVSDTSLPAAAVVLAGLVVVASAVSSWRLPRTPTTGS